MNDLTYRELLFIRDCLAARRTAACDLLHQFKEADLGARSALRECIDSIDMIEKKLLALPLAG